MKCFPAIAALLVLLGGVALAESPQPPPQTPSIKTEQQSDGAAKSQSQREQQVAPAEQIPAAGQQHATSDAERQAERDAEKRAEEASEYGVFFGRRLKITDALLALFTLFLVLVGIGQGIFLYRTDQGTHKAADAAKKAAEIAERTLNVTQRAFVFAKIPNASLLFNSVDGQVAGIRIWMTFLNTGNTPGQNMTARVGGDVFQGDIPNDWSYPVRNDPDPPMPIAPDVPANKGEVRLGIDIWQKIAGMPRLSSPGTSPSQ
jgi:hypothetical protein